ncbi:hypothetical protein CLOP_g21987 [Closterium sp. NIES-67]|nr:hypothetical protein CLOP_g21987 [Closterium sp. NIES-67]
MNDTEVKRYVIDIPAEGQPTWSQLPSIEKPKGAYFSGFEVSFDFHGVVEDLLESPRAHRDDFDRPFLGKFLRRVSVIDS